MLQKLISLLIILGLNTLYGESIDKYNTYILVKESGELSIKESITYHFNNEKKEYISFDIPFTFKKGKSIIDLELYNLSIQKNNDMVQWTKTIIKLPNKGKILRLKIGNKGEFLKEKEIYTISYKIKKGVVSSLSNPSEDAIYWHIGGQESKIHVNQIDTYISLPSSLSSYMLSPLIYKNNEISSSELIWKGERTLYIKTDTLSAQQKPYFELSFPSGLLKQNGLDNVKKTQMELFWSYWHWIAFFIAFIFLKYKEYKHTGFVDKEKLLMEFQIPKELSLLQAGFLTENFSYDKHFTSAIVELAHLGYLIIEHTNDNSTPLLIRTDKKEEGLTSDQDYILNIMLFSKDDKNTIRLHEFSSKEKKLKKCFINIKNSIYKWSLSKGYAFENFRRVRNNFLTQISVGLMLTFLLTLLTLIRDFGEQTTFLLLFPLYLAFVGIRIIYTKHLKIDKFIGFFIILAGISSFFLIKEDGLTLESFIIGPVGSFILILIMMTSVYLKLGRMSEKGVKASHNILGLKILVTQVKKEQLQKHLNKNPLYLEEILPYAILFNKTKRWLDFYKELNIAPPHWYKGDINKIDKLFMHLEKNPL